jgi:peroxiredoxin Q/BCP
MIEPGQPAPDFTLLDQHGKPVTLSAFRGSPTVLYFYPKDDTPGCTKEACGFRDDFAAYKKAGARIVGVSPDAPDSHAKFVQKFQLPFVLLSDSDHRVCEAYGVWKEKNMYGRKFLGVERTTYVIDGNGLVAQVFPRVKVEGHSAAVLAAIQRSR